MRRPVPYIQDRDNSIVGDRQTVSRASEMRSISFASAIRNLGDYATGVATAEQQARGTREGREAALRGEREPRSGFSPAGQAYNRAADAVEGEETARGIIDQETRAGELAGGNAALNGQFSFREGFTVRDRAFNAAGVSTAVAKMDGESAMHVQALSRKHRGDPDGFQEAVNKYALGIRAELAPISPQGAQGVANRIFGLAGSYRERLSKQSADLTRDRSEAALLVYDAQMGSLLDDISGDLFSEDQAVSSAAMGQLEVLANQALAEFDRVGPDGMPLHTEVEREAAKQDFIHRAVEEGLVKWFRGVEDLPSAIMRFRDGELHLSLAGQAVDVSATLPAEARARVLRVAAAELDHRNTVVEEAEKKAADAVKADQSANYYRTTVRMISGELTPQTVHEMWSNRELNDDDARDLQEALKSQQDAPPVTDPALSAAIMQSMYVDKIDPTRFILQNAGEISVPDLRAMLATANRLFSPDQADATRYDARTKREMDLLGQALHMAPELFATLDFGAKQRAYAAMDEFQIRVEEGEDPREVRTDLVQRSLQPDQMAIVNPATTLLQPQFLRLDGGQMSVDLTVAATLEALDKGEISKTQATRQLLLIEEWERALQRGQ